MIIKALNNNKIGAYSIMLLFLIGLWINPFFTSVNHDALYNVYPMPLWRGISGLQKNVYIASALGFIIVLINALLIIRLSTRYSMYSRPTALPGIVYIILASMFGGAQHLSPIGIGALAFLLSLNYIFETHSISRPAKQCFQAGFLLSISSLFYFKMIALFPLILLALYIVHVLNFKTFFASVIGMVLPWLYMWGYYLWINGSSAQLFADLQIVSERVFYHFEFTVVHWVVIGILLVMFLASLLSVVKGISTKKIFIRMIYRVVIFSALYCIGLAILTGVSYEFMLILSVPFSMILAHYFDELRSSLWQNIMFAALVVLTVFSQIYW